MRAVLPVLNVRLGLQMRHGLLHTAFVLMALKWQHAALPFPQSAKLVRKSSTPDSD